MTSLSQALFIPTSQPHSSRVFYDSRDIGFSPAKATRSPLFIREFVLIIAAGLQSSLVSTVPSILYGGPRNGKHWPGALSFPVDSS